MIEGLTLPRRLHPGDRVAAVTLSWGGPGAIPGRYEAGVRQLEERFGIEVIAMPHARDDETAVAANMQGRVDDLHAAFADDTIAGIVSTIGGDDSIRLLPLLDLDVITANPKVLLGYSDTTITQMACLRAGLQTFYGPAIMAGFGENGGLHGYLADGVVRMLFTPDAPGPWLPNPDGWTCKLTDWEDSAAQSVPRQLEPTTGWRWHGGNATVTGPLVPVCLDVLQFLRGSEWWPDLDGAVLALETSEEAPPPEAVERFLRSLALTGELAGLAAVLFGRPGGVAADSHAAYDEAILRVVRDEQGLDLPVVTGLDFGHTDPMWTVPVGGVVEVDPGAEQVRFPQPVTMN